MDRSRIRKYYYRFQTAVMASPDDNNNNIIIILHLHARLTHGGGSPSARIRPAGRLIYLMYRPRTETAPKRS